VRPKTHGSCQPKYVAHQILLVGGPGHLTSTSRISGVGQPRLDAQRAGVAGRRRITGGVGRALVGIHRDYRLAEEARLFEEIRGKAVKLEKLEGMKQSVALMRERELRLEGAVEDAKKAVVTAEEELQKAVEAHQEARRAVEKFEEFVDIQKAAEHKAAARKEEAETEEITDAAYATRTRGAL